MNGMCAGRALPVFTKKASGSQVIGKSQILRLSFLKDGSSLPCAFWIFHPTSRKHLSSSQKLEHSYCSSGLNIWPYNVYIFSESYIFCV